MCIAAAIGGAALGTVGASMIQGKAARSAADSQAEAARQAQATQQQMFQQVRGDLSPYNTAGQSATQALLAFYGLPGGRGPSSNQLTANLGNLPGMAFLQQQGAQQVNRANAARGLLNSGATGKELTRYGQGLAATYALPTYLGGLQGLAGQGENAAAQTGVFGTRTAEGIAGSQMGAGSAMAAGQVGSANAMSGMVSQLGGLGGLYGQYQMYGGAGGGGGGGAAGGGGASGSYPGAFPYYTSGGVWGGSLANQGPWGPAWTPWAQ